jgi:hypothetical protein
LGGAVLGAVLGVACAHPQAAAPTSDRAASVKSPQAAAAPPVTTDLPNLSPGAARITGERPAPSTSEFPPAPSPPPAVAASSGPELQPGAVQMIQQRLESNGALRTEQASGEMDAVTRAALARFQEANHLPPSGALDDATVRRLGLDPRRILVPEAASAE